MDKEFLILQRGPHDFDRSRDLSPEPEWYPFDEENAEDGEEEEDEAVEEEEEEEEDEDEESGSASDSDDSSSDSDDSDDALPPPPPRPVFRPNVPTVMSELPAELQKYYNQRYTLFTKFDQGVKMDHGTSRGGRK